MKFNIPTMESRKEILEKYYRGESTLEEERILKAAWRQGELQEEPVLSFGGQRNSLPPELKHKIRTGLRARQNHSRRPWLIIAGSAAAAIVLILSLRGLQPVRQEPGWQLSDNIKKERFEEALRTIGNVLEERTPPVQKVLYEDHNLIITVE